MPTSKDSGSAYRSSLDTNQVERSLPPARPRVRLAATPSNTVAADPSLAAVANDATPSIDDRASLDRPIDLDTTAETVGDPHPATSAAPAYDVGYRKPPRTHQFKSGQSGNPKGRPKGAKSLPTLVDEALSASMTISVRGRSMKMTKRQAMVMQHVEKAMRGDLKTFAALVKLDPKARQEAEDHDRRAPVDLNEEEMATLLSYVRATNPPEDDQ